MMVTFYKFWKLGQFFFNIYKSYVLANIQLILLHKCEMHTSKTCYCFSCWSFAIRNWPPYSIFLCFCSRTTVYSNLVFFEYSQLTVTILNFYHPTLHSILHLLVIPFYYYFLLYFQSICFNYAIKICMNFCFILQTC